MTKYVRLCKTTNTKGDIIPLGTSSDIDKRVKVSPNSDWYTSLFHYEQEAYDYFQEHNSINGFKGKATLDQLVFDLDSKGDVDKARKDGVTLLTRLKEEGVEVRDNVNVYFSGGKGFHVHVLLGKEFTNDEIKNICSGLAEGLDSFDAVVYNTTRLFRVPNTKHNKSGLYKIPLTPEELYSKSVSDIKKLAKTARVIQPNTTPVSNISFVEKYNIEVRPTLKSVVVDDTDGIRGLEDVDFSNCPNNTPRCVYALTHGIMESGQGERSQIFLRLAAFYRNQGHTKESTYGLLKGVARDNARLYPEHEAFTASEIWNTVIQSVFSATGWEARPGTTGIDPENATFKKYCDAVGEKAEVPCCLHQRHTKPDTVVTITGIENSFDDFATNFDKNIVPTGIKLIDDYMKIAVGTTTLIAGACGCHRKGEKVLMFDGSIKAVEDIKVGELLMGPDSTPRKVLELKRGQDSMYEIVPVKGSPFYVNGNHVLSHLNSHKNWQHCTVNELLERSHDPKNMSGRCLVRAGVDFPSREVLMDPYILGVWLGDGHSSCARVTTIDEEILSEMNVYNNKHIPEEYKINDRETRLQILAGLLDTDGYLGDNCFDFIQKRKDISEDVAFIARSLGMAAYVTECQKASQNGTWGTYYRVSISGNTDEIPTRIKRKQATKRKQIKSVNRVGFSINKVAEMEDYYGFSLDQDNLYLLEDFTVTHNSGKTTLCLNIMENANSLGQHTMFFSLDMNKNLVYLKLAQKVTSYKQDEILKFYKERNLPKIDQIKKAINIKYGKTYFDFSATMSIEDMRDKVMLAEEKHNCKIKLVVVDYASRVSGQYSDVYANARYNALKSTEVAGDTNAAWIWLNQVSRNSGDGSSPLRSKRVAKDSGDWEESATNVITCWRPFMGQEQQDDIMRLFLAKNRMGKEVERPLHWDGAKGKVWDMTNQELLDYKEEREAVEKDKTKKGWN